MTATTPEAALAAALRWTIPSPMHDEVGHVEWSLETAAAILAALDGWTLVPADEMIGTRALAAALEGKRDEIERLRAALGDYSPFCEY